MRIEHIALWVKNPETILRFYTTYFGASIGPEYYNPKKNFRSWFLTFAAGARLEIMNNPDIPDNKNSPYTQYQGVIHFAISTGSEKNVDTLTQRLKNDGFEILDGPRTTGDGYYESVVLDPEKNRVEITV